MVEFMKALIKCHYNYLINKTTILLFVFVILISISTFVLNVFTLDENLTYQESNAIYFHSSFMTIKMIIIFLSIFLICNIFLPKNNQYYYLISYNVSRRLYFITKISLVFSLEITFVFLLFMFYHLIGFIGYDKYQFDCGTILSFFNLWLLLIFYSFLALIVFLLIKNNYIVLVIFSIFIFSMILNEDNSLFASLINFFILYLKEDGTYYYKEYHALFSISALFLINLYVYDIFDL